MESSCVAFSNAPMAERSIFGSRRWLQSVITLAVVIAVATVLIAPSIDMPDGVLRAHSVVGHSTAASQGTITVSAKASSSHTHEAWSAIRISESRQVSSRGVIQRSMVLRC